MQEDAVAAFVPGFVVDGWSWEAAVVGNQWAR